MHRSLFSIFICIAITVIFFSACYNWDYVEITCIVTKNQKRTL